MIAPILNISIFSIFFVSISLDKTSGATYPTVPHLKFLNIGSLTLIASPKSIIFKLLSSFSN